MDDDIIRCYRTLEIEPGASITKVAQAYRDLVKVWHPDRFPNSARLQKKADEKLKEVNLAYERLQNYADSKSEGSVSLRSETPAQSEFLKVKTAAEKGDPKAQCTLAFMYASGNGVTENDVEAFKWNLRAAEGGNGQAQQIAGIRYQQGFGVAKDLKAAAYWYEKASEQGFADSLNTLARMYEKGQGVQRDYIQAYKWLSIDYTLALAGGWNPGRIDMRRLAKKMSRDELIEAQRRAADFIRTHPHVRCDTPAQQSSERT